LLSLSFIVVVVVVVAAAAAAACVIGHCRFESKSKKR